MEKSSTLSSSPVFTGADRRRRGISRRPINPSGSAMSPTVPKVLCNFAVAFACSRWISSMRQPYHDRHTIAAVRSARSITRMRNSLEVACPRPHLEAAAAGVPDLDAQLVEATVQRRVRRLEADCVAVTDVVGDPLKRLPHVVHVLGRE